MKKLILPVLCLLSLISLRSAALNVTIIASAPYTMDVKWQQICVSMGNTATIYSDTMLNSVSNLSSTDILIVSSAQDVNITAASTSVIQQYLQKGGKVYLQSEYLASFPGNVAYQSLVDSLGGYFNWTGTVSGTLVPMNILGSIATDYAVTSPLPYFWYGQSIDPCSTVEMFQQYQGNYFGCIFCVSSSGGRVITSSDQDWVQQSNLYPASDSLMKNIIYNLAKTTYNCSNSGAIISVNLGRDTTLCTGNSIVLSPGAGYSSYLWKGGETTASITVNAAGAYWVKVTSPCGSSASDTINIAILPCNIPDASLLSSDSAFCANSCISYTDLSTNNPTSWLWTFQGALPPTSTDQNPQSVCYPNGGTFSVTLVASNSSGTDTVVFTNFINVFNAPPTPTISQSNDSLFCSYDPSYSSYQWYDSTTLIAGAVNPDLVINHSGNYNVSVTNENGCSIAVGIYALFDAVLQLTEDNHLYIYPNPADKALTINTDFAGAESKIRNIIIYNSFGEVIRSLSFAEAKSETIDIENLSSGIYFVEATTQSSTWRSRFIKR